LRDVRCKLLATRRIGVAACASAVLRVVLVSTRSAWFWPTTVTLLVSLPCLFVGFSHDDLTHRLMLEGKVPGFRWYGLYDFTPPGMPASAMIEQGSLPWFTNPEISLRFLRPVASATQALDHVLFGRRALPAHLQSLLWMAALAAIAARLYRRWFEPGAARLCAIVYALSGVHAMPTAWLASRHTLVSATFGALALWAWARWREDHFEPGRALALACLGLSLLSSESGLVAVALLVSYEVGTKGTEPRLRRAALPLLVGLAYLGAYAALGFGARSSAFYVSPFSAPLAYALTALEGVPALGAELLLGLPSAVSGLGGSASAALFVALGLLAFAGAGTLLYRLRDDFEPGARRNLLWLSLGSFIGLFALVGAPVTGRVLPLPLLGGSAVVGHVLWAAWRRARQRQVGAWWVAVGLLGVLHLGLAPLLRVGVALQFKEFAEAQRRLALDTDVGACAERGALYLLTGSDPILSLYLGPALLFYAPDKARAEHLRTLSMAPQSQVLTRVSATAFELEVLDPPRWGNDFEHLFRDADNPLRDGQRIQLPELSVLVSETSAGLFTRARFTLSREPEALPICLLVWRDGRLQPLPLPAVGQGTRLEHSAGPTGM
jgi:dolichyl-phosphate-mannose-protein mannosyltransferase